MPLIYNNIGQSELQYKLTTNIYSITSTKTKLQLPLFLNIKAEI